MESVNTLGILTGIFNNIYSIGNIPKELVISEFIMLPKEQGAKAKLVLGVTC